MAVSISAMFLVPVRPLDFSRGDAQGRRMAEDETGEVPKLPPDARLESLDERLDRLQQAEAKRTAKRKPDPTYQAGQLILSQLVGAPPAARCDDRVRATEQCRHSTTLTRTPTRYPFRCKPNDRCGPRAPGQGRAHSGALE